MKKILPFFVFAFLVIMLGCSDKTTQDINPATTCMPSSINQEGSTWVYLYEYDDQNRVSRIRWTNGSSLNYKYTPNSLSEYSDYGSGPSFILEKKADIVLDAEGRIVNYSIDTDTPPFVTKLSYNKEGYIEETTHYIKNKVRYNTKYTYTNGNLTQMVGTDPEDAPKSEVTKIEYYLDKKNVGRIAEFIFDEELIESGTGRFILNRMLGNSMRNLPKRQDGKEILDFFYDFDEKGRVIKLTISDAQRTNRKQVYNFGYDNCK